MNVIYLDYDGVLHPSEVFRSKEKGIHLSEEYPSHYKLFMWQDLLAQALRPYPDVKIVLSTSWVRQLNYDDAKAYLLKELQVRVVGATFHSGMQRGPYDNSFGYLSRYQQIKQDVTRRMPTKWVAVDDDDEGWPFPSEFPDGNDHLIKSWPDGGLSYTDTYFLLEQTLESWYKKSEETLTGENSERKTDSPDENTS